MNTVHRSAGLRFVIFVADHEPAHVHVFGDGEARIEIETGRILTNRRLPRRDLALAVRVVKERREIFLEAWRQHHG